jgi:uncharacterized protein
MEKSSTATSAAECAAEIATPNASRYLQQLCKHFAHKIPATCDERAGEITFPRGACSLAATDGQLTISLASPDVTQMVELQDVVARHLVRFAFREDLRIAWQPH